MIWLLFVWEFALVGYIDMQGRWRISSNYLIIADSSPLFSRLAAGKEGSWEAGMAGWLAGFPDSRIAGEKAASLSLVPATSALDKLPTSLEL